MLHVVSVCIPCCMHVLLCVVGSCFAKSETGQATCKRSQQLPTLLGVENEEMIVAVNAVYAIA